jgi:hypothetical protein
MRQCRPAGFHRGIVNKSKTKKWWRENEAAPCVRSVFRRADSSSKFERLKPPYRVQPFSNDSITALELEYRRILVEDVGDNDAELLMSLAPYKANRETLIKDLKALGIRSQRRKQISG